MIGNINIGELYFTLLISTDQSVPQCQIDFTGNWFIDIGILGFINLMEEVYKWDLKKIREGQIDRKEFLYAYFVYYIKKTAFEWIVRQELSSVTEDEKSSLEEMKKNAMSEIEKVLKDSAITNYDGIKNKLLDINSTIKNIIEDKFKKYENNLKKSFSNNKKTILQKINETGMIINEPFFQNLNFLNPTTNKKENALKVLDKFGKMLSDNQIKNKLTKDAMDKTISKYLFSEEEFPNIPFCKISTLNDVDKLTNGPTIFFLLSFPIPFNRVYDRNIVFYTNNLESCYYINKNIRIRIQKVKDENPDTIFKVTWQSIIDYVAEQKSMFFLENMYLIEYETIQQQNLIGVEYFGIPKLQASILLDDKIREALNTKIQCKAANRGGDRCWLVEEFIKERSLYSIIVNHINLVLNGDYYINWMPCLYGLLVDAHIVDFRGKNKNLFSDNFFDNYKALVKEIKDDVRITTFSSSLINKISNDEDTRKRVARDLYSALCGKDKNMFLNILLKNVNENKELPSNRNFYNWILEKIISNDASYEMYGLILVMNLLRRGKNE